MEQEKLKLKIDADVTVKYWEEDGSLNIEGPVAIKFHGKGLLSILGSVKVVFGVLSGILSQVSEEDRKDALTCMKELIEQGRLQLEEDIKDIQNGTIKSYKPSKDKGELYN